MYAFYANEGELQVACRNLLGKFTYDSLFDYTYINEMNFMIQWMDLTDVEKALFWVATTFMDHELDENLAVALRNVIERLGFRATNHHRAIDGGFGLDISSRFIGCGMVHVICQWVRK